MIALALRIIAHSPMRYIVALLGISVAAGLAFIQLGLYRGFKENASMVVDHTQGDIWVCAEFSDNFDFPNALNKVHLDQVRATPGVQWAYPMLVVFADWKLADGESQTVQVVGFDSEKGVGGPWTMIEGLPKDLIYSGNVTVDVVTRDKLGFPDIGSEAEVNGIKVRVTGFSEEIRSFQGKPMIFADMDTVRSIARLNPDELHYVIVGTERDADVAEVAHTIQDRIKHVEAYAAPDFSRKAQDYWLTTTGAGKALALAALLGLIVGVVVAGQVLYTSTLEHLKEFGTLKAIGATNMQVAVTIVSQAIAWALPAHLIAGGLLLIAMQNIKGIGIHLAVDTRTYMILGAGTVVVCVAASILSVVRVMRVEPADVFKG